MRASAAAAISTGPPDASLSRRERSIENGRRDWSVVGAAMSGPRCTGLPAHAAHQRPACSAVAPRLRHPHGLRDAAHLARIDPHRVAPVGHRPHAAGGGAPGARVVAYLAGTLHLQGTVVVRKRDLAALGLLDAPDLAIHPLEGGSEDLL